tara:strand:+ start:310 stop:462 length:153 start_codon:yes stop_codon:yes gene_type:complete
MNNSENELDEYLCCDPEPHCHTCCGQGWVESVAEETMAILSLKSEANDAE